MTWKPPDPDWPADLLWRQSPWDHKVHIFPALGEIHSEALCQHSALTDRLINPLPMARACLACLVIQSETMWNGGEAMGNSNGGGDNDLPGKDQDAGDGATADTPEGQQDTPGDAPAEWPPFPITK